MDRELGLPLDPWNGGLDLVNQGHDIAGIARIPQREMRGKDKASGGFRDEARLASKLGWTVAFAFEERRNGAIVGSDDFAVAQRLALGEPLRLAADSVIRFQRAGQLGRQSLAFWLTQMPGVLESLLGTLSERHEGEATRQELLFRLAHQRHEDFALPAALSAKTAHELLESVVERMGLGLQRSRLRDALGRDGLDEVEDFF